MASSNTFKSIWTSVLAALVALFAALGLGGSAAAPAASSVAAPAAPAVPAGSVARTMAAQARRSWRAMMRGGSLPPTIAQRIRAEAHGSTPPSAGAPRPPRPTPSRTGPGTRWSSSPDVGR